MLQNYQGKTELDKKLLRGLLKRDEIGKKQATNAAATVDIEHHRMTQALHTNQ